MTVDYYVDVPEDKKEEFIQSLDKLNVWVEGNEEGERLWLQGHGMFYYELERRGYDFTSSVSGSMWDLFECWSPEGITYEVIHHGYDGKSYVVTPEQYEEVWDNMSNEDYFLNVS